MKGSKNTILVKYKKNEVKESDPINKIKEKDLIKNLDYYGKEKAEEKPT